MCYMARNRTCGKGKLKRVFKDAFRIFDQLSKCGFLDIGKCYCQSEYIFPSTIGPTSHQRVDIKSDLT